MTPSPSVFLGWGAFHRQWCWVAIASHDVERLFRPTDGGSLELSLEQVGFWGDFSWWKADLEWTQFFFMGTDDQGRNRVLRNARLGIFLTVCLGSL